MTDPGSSPHCPACKQPLPPPDHDVGPLSGRWPHFPFCSERCRLLDLNGWLTGGFVIPGPPVDPDAPPADLPRGDAAGDR